jgi:hypothetical protein
MSRGQDDRETMSTRSNVRRAASLLIVGTLAIGASGLALAVLHVTQAARYAQGLLTADEPFTTDIQRLDAAGGVLTAEALLGLVLGVLVVLAARRVLFVVSAAWSLAALATAAWLVAVAAPLVTLYQADTGGIPMELASLLVGAMALLCLSGSAIGFVVTPFGWDWLSAPASVDSGSLAPPPTAPT